MMITKLEGRLYEVHLIKRVNKMTVYIPQGCMDVSGIKVIDKRKIVEYIKQEGYGR